MVFLGMESASISAGEIKNPEVNIKRSTIIGNYFASIIYLLLSILAMGGLSQGDLANSDAPLASIINSITGLSWGGSFISLAIAISAAGTASGCILTTVELHMLLVKMDYFLNFLAKLAQNSKHL